MSIDERAYYQTRAEQEIQRAQKADHPEAVKAHYLLAGFYLDLVHGAENATEARAA